MQWQYRADHPATAVDTDGDTVYVAYNSGALIALDANDGSVRWHTELKVDGAPTTALSLAGRPKDTCSSDRRRPDPGVPASAVPPRAKPPFFGVRMPHEAAPPVREVQCGPPDWGADGNDAATRGGYGAGCCCPSSTHD
ncbi:PQQ-like beta-propeller repeat protein [Streptomyces mutabilis]|uniref:PQQ-binding-like beta-propeller repeat protein n=1 Tax=Streptomyces mutabilis TaxID=67332 RepID=UPI0022BA3C37|nr:PQQ-binding-like beta-propeller repeat protein [Streptomyces mutabilis]MCZ9349206.1 PQQ-like beta-propeller repeat protein [Streptomyces mutabilis]MCZ9353774.1 PQQ-like beta-propeller repeat protein [Streptomyces mutabilis]